MEYPLEWYSPDEDSYTLVDVLKQENIKNSLIVDLGTSTGFITKSLDKSNIIISTDLNIKALHRQKIGNLIHMDLLDSIRQDLVEIIIFNPPYVLDSSCPIIGGGVNGRNVIDRFIKQVECKTFYLLVIEANKPNEIIKELENKGYKIEIKKIRKILGETIIILKGILQLK
ncbi:eRF1 methyltransferase catalytic subunit (MTQ2) [Vairimorpha necatrix]|uniref:ERF1 methyltransferase catalytic subunit (MTQ2) n=1 Tax=Vairimorpha necatrix TaxID=6039 RepID=A0AAX4JDM0_9MICR